MKPKLTNRDDLLMQILCEYLNMYQGFNVLYTVNKILIDCKSAGLERSGGRIIFFHAKLFLYGLDRFKFLIRWW